MSDQAERGRVVGGVLGPDRQHGHRRLRLRSRSPQIAPGLPAAVVDSTPCSTACLIIVFLLFEPLGLYGIWVKIRNYWKGWPFSY